MGPGDGDSEKGMEIEREKEGTRRGEERVGRAEERRKGKREGKGLEEGKREMEIRERKRWKEGADMGKRRRVEEGKRGNGRGIKKKRLRKFVFLLFHTLLGLSLDYLSACLSIFSLLFSVSYSSLSPISLSSFHSSLHFVHIYLLISSFFPPHSLICSPFLFLNSYLSIFLISSLFLELDRKMNAILQGVCGFLLL